MDNLHEDHEIMAGGKIDLNNESVLDAMNSALADVTASPSLTAYIAWGRVAKVLATYHVPLPKTFLEGNRGHEVIPINQFGNKMGMTDDGKVVVNNESNLFLYFEWQQNDMGDFDIFAEVVTSVDLPELLKSYEEDVSDLEESYDPKELKMGSKDEKEEHGLSKKAAVKTAKDHLRKVDKHYYSKLKSVGLEEMKDELNEISKKLMVNYMTKADKEVKGIEKTMKKTGDFTPEQDKQLTKRVKGMNIARDKFYKRGKVAATGKDKAYDQAQTILIAKNKKKSVSEAVEDLSKKSDKELKAFIDKNYGGGVPRFGTGAAVERHYKELKRRDAAKNKKKSVNEEQLDELSKPLLRRYAKKASWSSMAAKIGDDGQKARRRAKGLKRAGDRLGNTMMVKKKYLAKEEKAPFDNPTETPSTPYKNPHSKAKQLARAAMRKAMTSDKAFAKLSKKDQTEVNRRLRMSEENINEISQKKAADAYASANDPDSYHPKADKILGHIKRKFGKKAADGAEDHAYATHFGRKHSSGDDSLKGGLRKYLSKDTTKAGKIKHSTVQGMKANAKNTKVGGPKGHLPEETLNELHGKGKLEKMTKEYERKADAAKAGGKKILDNKSVGKTMKFSNEVEKWNTNMAKARRGYQLMSKRDKETVDEATLGGEKYKGKSNPNNEKSRGSADSEHKSSVAYNKYIGKWKGLISHPKGADNMHRIKRVDNAIDASYKVGKVNKNYDVNKHTSKALTVRDDDDDKALKDPTHKKASIMEATLGGLKLKGKANPNNKTPILKKMLGYNKSEKVVRATKDHTDQRTRADYALNHPEAPIWNKMQNPKHSSKRHTQAIQAASKLSEENVNEVSKALAGRAYKKAAELGKHNDERAALYNYGAKNAFSDNTQKALSAATKKHTVAAEKNWRQARKFADYEDKKWHEGINEMDSWPPGAMSDEHAGRINKAREAEDKAYKESQKKKAKEKAAARRKELKNEPYLPFGKNGLKKFKAKQLDESEKEAYRAGYDAWSHHLTKDQKHRPANPYKPGKGMGEWERGAADAYEKHSNERMTDKKHLDEVSADLAARAADKAAYKSAKLVNKYYDYTHSSPNKKKKFRASINKQHNKSIRQELKFRDYAKKKMDEATLGGDKYMGKANPNNGTKNRNKKVLQNTKDRFSDYELDAWDKWERNEGNPKKADKYAREHDRAIDVQDAITRVMKKKKIGSSVNRLSASRKLNEVSASKLGRYITKASSQQRDIQKRMNAGIDGTGEGISRKTFRRGMKRLVGSELAIKKLTGKAKVPGTINEVSKELLQRAGSKAFDKAHSYRWKGDDKRADKKIGQVDKIRSYMAKKGMKIDHPKVPEPDELQKRYNELEYKGD